MSDNSLGFPKDFTSGLTLLDPNEIYDFLESLKQKPIVSIRTQLDKDNSVLIKSYQVAWCENGFYLNKRPIFSEDPHFHGGTYYVQEASSMALAHVLKKVYNPQKHFSVLDMCASPGGKTTLISDQMNEDVLILANEAIQSRVSPLIENVVKWGKPNVYVSQNDPIDFEKIESFFDLIVLDAPCSGEGMFRKIPESAKQWSLDLVNLCSARQKRILLSTHKALKPGGFLLYSTCTWSTKENEDNMKFMIENYGYQSINTGLEQYEGIVHTENNGYRFYPHKIKGEGFFICVLQKVNEEEELDLPLKKFKAEKEKLNFEAQLWIKNDSLFSYNTDYYKIINATLKTHESRLLLLANKLKLIKKSNKIGQSIGKDFLPEHDFALSNLKINTLPFVNLNFEQAIKYLMKEDFKIEEHLSVGWYLVKYQNTSLGWVKILPNRINNYFPTAWRLRNFSGSNLLL